MTDFDLQQQLIEQRRRQYAGQRDFQTPQGQMVGRHYVAPNALQYLAAGLRSIGGMRGQDIAEQELKQLGQQRSEGNQKALAEFLRQSQGTPENAPTDGMGPVLPAQAPNLQGAYSALLNAPDAGLRNMGMQAIAQMPEQQARAADRQAELEFRKQSAEAQRQQRMQEIQLQHQQRMEYLQQNNADRAAMAAEQRAFQQQMAQVAAANRQSSAQPYFQPVQTAQGVMAFNARTGRVEPVMGPNGAPIVGAAADPTLQGALAGAKAGAQTEAKTQTEARLGAPQSIAQGEETIRLVDDLLKAPGMKQAVGASRLLGIQNIPGTAAKDFEVRLDQLKGQQFLQAFESLKGGGQITEVEGKKATDAIARMNAASSENEFVKASREFQDVIRAGVNRAKKAQGGVAPAPAASKRIRFDAQGNVIQ
jgi:hypothetical protein